MHTLSFQIIKLQYNCKQIQNRTKYNRNELCMIQFILFEMRASVVSLLWKEMQFKQRKNFSPFFVDFLKIIFRLIILADFLSIFQPLFSISLSVSLSPFDYLGEVRPIQIWTIQEWATDVLSILDTSKFNFGLFLFCLYNLWCAYDFLKTYLVVLNTLKINRYYLTKFQREG